MLIKLNSIKKAAGSVKKLKRVGRGNGSGCGGTAGRGHKGQRSRSGFSLITGFEGGQMPLYRRMPKNKGFKKEKKVTYQIVGLEQLSVFSDGAVVDNPSLYKAGLIEREQTPVKILANGVTSKKLTINVEKISKKALEIINTAGGKYGEAK